MTIFFKHCVGDGIHYVTDNFKTFKDGSFQLGDTSDVCIIFNLELLLVHNNVPYTVDELWNMAYPGDFMAMEDVAYIISVAVDFCEPFNPTVPDNISAVIDDVRSMGCKELADLVEAEIAKVRH